MPINLTTMFSLVGDGMATTAVLTISSGANALSSSTNLWVSGDVNKIIRIAGAGASGGVLSTSIATFVDAKHITLVDNAGTALAGVSTPLEWGTNNHPMYLNIRDWGSLQAQPPYLDLVISPGTYMSTGFPCFLNDGDTITGVTHATIDCTGVTFTEVWLGGVGQFFDSNHHALIDSVLAGANTVRLKTAAEISRFSVGQTVTITNADIMGFGGPSNPAWFEFRKIQSISGQFVTLTEKLTHRYYDTLPLYYDSVADSNFGFLFQGGPACMYALSPMFDNDLTWINATTRGADIAGNSLQTYGPGKKLTFNNCTFHGDGYIPTDTDTVTLNGGRDGENEIEFDKMVGNFTANGTAFGQLKFQSRSLNCRFYNCTVDRSINGTCGDFIFEGGSVGGGVSLGPAGFGASDSIVFKNVAIAGAIGTGNLRQPLSDFTYLGGGLFRSTGLGAFSYPGTWGYFGQTDGTSAGNVFQILDMWSSGVNPDKTAQFVYYKTTWAGPLPTYTGATVATLCGFSAPNITFQNCTGHWSAVGLSNAPSGRPYGEYSEHTVFSNNWLGRGTGQGGDTMFSRGRLVEIKIDVQRIYTGPNATDTMDFGFGGYDLTNTVQFFTTTVDLKTPGVRIITPTTVTGSVGIDTLGSPPGSVWIADFTSIQGTSSGSDTLAQQAIINIRVKTNTGVINNRTNTSWRMIS